MANQNLVSISGDGDSSLYFEMLSRFEAAALEDVLEQIAILSAGFPQGYKDEETITNSIKAYAKVVEGLPFEPVSMAVSNFLHGVVPDQNTKFMPTAPDFAKEVRRVFFLWEFRSRKKS